MEAREILLTIYGLVMVLGRLVSSECTGNYPLMSGLHFSVLDYQITSNSRDTTCYMPADQFGENSDCEELRSYEGRIGADHYRGWCSEHNAGVRSYLQVDFGREVVIRQVETQGLLINTQARYITSFWLAYSTSAAEVFINVTEENSTTTKVFPGQDVNNYRASMLQDLPYSISARIVRLYSIAMIPPPQTCTKLEFHGCVPQRAEECQSVYQLSCCAYGEPGDLISNVEVSSEERTGDKPGEKENILTYNDVTKYWCADRYEPFPNNATFYFTEEILLTSVAYHGFDGENADDYVTLYSWEYSVGNSSFRTYADLNNMTEFVNNREDKFQQTFWNPIRVQTLRFVIHDKNIRPCIAFQFFGCKLSEVISRPQISSVAPSSTTVSSFSDATTTTDSVMTSTTSTSAPNSTTKRTTSVIPTMSCPPLEPATVTVVSTMVVMSSLLVSSSPVMTTSSSVMVEPFPTPSSLASKCYGDEEALISGTRYYVSDDQLSASGYDPLHYTYDNMNERVLLRPEECRIGNMYSSFLGWCSQIVTNLVNNAPYIQVEFGTDVVVSAGAIQGIEINGDERQPRYVSRFRLAYMDLESEEFCVVNDEDGNPMTIQGNNGDDYRDDIKFTIPTEIRGRIFRLYPLNWTSSAVVDGTNTIDTGRACLKWELFGCAELESEELHHCQPDQAEEFNDMITNITSNSNDDVVKTSFLRYKDDDDHWCPSVEGVDLPLVISFSFDKEVIITSMVIAGRETRNADYFITSYSLSYATNDDLCNLTQYKDLFGRSVFHNNHVRPFFHSFWEPIRVRQFQLLIADWHITPCLSVGLFGCRNSEGDTDTTSVETPSPSDGVCTAPSNNVLLSCVGVEEVVSNNDNNVSTVVIIVLSVCLLSLLVIIATIYLWRIAKKKFSRKRYKTGSPLSMISDNPMYERNSSLLLKVPNDQYDQIQFNSQQERQASVLKCNALYSKLQPTGVDDEEEKYQKLEHHKRDSTLSVNQYDRVQDYAKDGPLESDTTYEDLPYFKVDSKSN